MTEPIHLHIIRFMLSFIPGIGGLFLMAIMFDFVPIRRWKYYTWAIMMVHCAYMLWVFWYLNLFTTASTSC